MTDVFLNIGCRYTRMQVTPESCCRNLISPEIRMGLYRKGSLSSAQETLRL